MSEFSEADSSRTPPWLLAGRGIGPQLKWHVGTDGPLTCLACAPETGDVFVADQSGALTRVDRRGRISALTRLHQPIVSLAWSHDGSQGAGLAGDDVVLRFDRDLRILNRLSLPDVGLAIAVPPFGNQLAVSLADSSTILFNDQKRRLARFDTIRPLAFMNFCTTEPLLFSAAEHGLVCCHNLDGAELWQQKNWTSIGRMRLSGDGEQIYLAGFTHGVQTLDHAGNAIGSYVLDGTVHRVDASFDPQRLIAATIERSLMWLDSDGELLWATRVSDDVVDVLCDPLGEWAICGLAEQGIYRLDWGGV